MRSARRRGVRRGIATLLASTTLLLPSLAGQSEAEEARQAVVRDIRIERLPPTLRFAEGSSSTVPAELRR